MTGQWTRPRRTAAATVMAIGFAAMVALAPAAAYADFGVSNFRAETLKADGTTLDTQAGGHPYTGVTSFSLNTTGGLPDGDLKDIRVDIPPGLIPNPEAVPKCTAPTPSLCPANTQVGTTEIVAVLRPSPLPLALPPLPVYNMEPPPGKVSDFAFGIPFVNPRVDIIGGVRDTDDYGVFFTISDIAANPSIISTKLTFFGVPADHGTGAPRKPFLTNPTVCGPPYTTRLTVEDHTGKVATASDTTPTGATGCDQVPFDPTVSVAPATTRRDSPTGAAVTLKVPQLLDPDGVETSHVRDTAISLPEGMTINPAAATGLQACTDAQLAKGTHDPVGCPAASRVGAVEIVSPALADPLTGDVWIGQPLAGDTYRVFLRATGPSGLDVRLKGSVRPDPATGRLTATFADTPQVPFSSFKLTFDGGPRAVLATPLGCGPAVTTSTVTPYRGAPPASPTSAFTVDEDGAGAACGATPFAPGFGASATSSLAGADTGLAVRVTRADGQKTLSRLQVTAPPGLTGRIPSVPLCPETAATAGTCAPTSRIGTATVAAGAGSEPFSLSGPVYLTGPHNGAPYGLAVVVRVLAGPYDLGTIVVRAAIRVDRRDAHLTVESDALPTIVGGVPLRLRQLDVTVDRPGFLLNPTSCGAKTVPSAIRAVDGTTATPSGQVAVSGCEALAFTPALEAVASGRPTRKRGGSLVVTLRQPANQMRLRKVSVKLPRAFSARGTTVARACYETTFVPTPEKCGTPSRVGTAEAITPVLPTPLKGTAWLVGHNAKLPTLEVGVSGSNVDIGLSSLITFGRSFSSTFDNLPDVPVSSFVVRLPQGPNSALGIAGDVCSRKLSMPSTFTGQDGRVRKQTVRLRVEDCPVSVRRTRILRGGRALLTVRVPSSGRLTVRGTGLRRYGRTLRRASGSAHVTVSLTRSGVRKLARARARGKAATFNATARFVPRRTRTTATSSRTTTVSRDVQRVTLR